MWVIDELAEKFSIPISENSETVRKGCDFVEEIIMRVREFRANQIREHEQALAKWQADQPATTALTAPVTDAGRQKEKIGKGC